MDLQGWSSLILSLVGVGGLATSYRLSKRGAKAQEEQDQKAGRLAERVQAFDELESLNGRLNDEIERLRKVASETEAAGQRRIEWQAQRCRHRLEELIATVTTLQGVVLSEVAKVSAGESAASATAHIESDHAESD